MSLRTAVQSIPGLTLCIDSILAELSLPNVSNPGAATISADKGTSLRQQALERELLTLQQQREAVRLAMGRLEDHRLISLLQYRYFVALPWPEVAAHLHCSLRHTMRLHKSALAALDALSADTNIAPLPPPDDIDCIFRTVEQKYFSKHLENQTNNC